MPQAFVNPSRSVQHISRHDNVETRQLEALLGRIALDIEQPKFNCSLPGELMRSVLKEGLGKIRK